MKVNMRLFLKKDDSNELFKPIETLILGSNGFLGSELLKYIPNSVGSTKKTRKYQRRTQIHQT